MKSYCLTMQKDDYSTLQPKGVKDAGHGSVVSESEFKPEDPGFDPLAGQGDIRFFCPSESTLVQTCLCLTPPPSVWHAPTYLRTLKIPYPSVMKE